MKLFYQTFLIALCLTCASAFGYTSDNKAPNYKNGPAILTYNPGKIGVGYYFGKKNWASVDFWVKPYISSQNVGGVRNLNSHRTSIGADLLSHIPIMQNAFASRLFVLFGAGWEQTFGTSLNIKGKYCWEVSVPITGLEYRFNDHLYFGLQTAVYHIRRTNNEGYRSVELFQNIYDVTSTYLVLKF